MEKGEIDMYRMTIDRPIKRRHGLSNSLNTAEFNEIVNQAS